MPIVARGERRIFDVRAIHVGGGSVGVAIDASETNALSSALVRMAEAHRRTLDQLSSGVAVFDGQRRLAFYNESYRSLWDLEQSFLDGHPDDSSGRRASCRSRRISAPGRPSCTKPIAPTIPPKRPGSCPTAAHSASSPRRTPRAVSPICSTTSPKASTSRGSSTA
jgi:hypothetical protein